MKKGIIWFIGVIFVLGVIGNLTEEDTKEPGSDGEVLSQEESDEAEREVTAKNESVEIDPEEFDYYDMTIEEYMDESTSERREIASEYVEFFDLASSSSGDFHSCLSYLVRYKSKEIPVGKLLGWCKQDYDKDPAELAKGYVDHDKFESNFSVWDGSHIKLERLIEDNMNDPGSYEHVDTRYRLVLNSEPKHAVVTTKFRGRNAYGGMVLNIVTAKVDIEDGTVLEIVSQN